MRENISNESEKQLAGAYRSYHKPDSFFASRSEWTVRELKTSKISEVCNISHSVKKILTVWTTHSCMPWSQTIHLKKTELFLQKKKHDVGQISADLYFLLTSPCIFSNHVTLQCHLNCFSSPLRCIVWTSAGHVDHVYMLKHTDSLQCNWPMFG